MKISVIITTYNRPDALDLVLQSLESQDDCGFEIIVADDGSADSTRLLVEEHATKSAVDIFHVWQEDLGFRAAAIRNKGLRKSSGEYIIFLDGDCIVQPDFIRRHRCLIQLGYVVTGSRVLIEEQLTNQILTAGFWDFRKFRRNSFFYFIGGQLNKWLFMFIKLGNHPFRLYRKFVWRKIKSCNLACWRKDAMAIGGFDEAFVGWGHEDADFVFRLFNQLGVNRKSGSMATEVLHLCHPYANRSMAEANEKMIRNRIFGAKQN